MRRPVYDLSLFKELNQEYSDTPLVPRPRKFVAKELFEEARKRAKMVDKHLNLRNKRVLEIGCGRGHLCHVLAEEYNCEVVGLDVVKYDNWGEESKHSRVEYLVHDISSNDNSKLGAFDVAVSMVVWEHIEHPYGALEGLRTVLNEGGRAYLSANLYRGPKASHRYRDVYFPWPHLLFDDVIFEQFYNERGRNNVRAAWVNKLTVAHYLMYFRQLRLDVEKDWYATTPIDEAFYARFEDKLGRYPRFDLEHDFIHVVLQKTSVNPLHSAPPTAIRKKGPLHRRIRKVMRQKISQAKSSIRTLGGGD